ncbi:MAG: hypothetical protein QG657_4296 [Acidobacteriota bacterium]|nr:hypothetical protein [Acidobacteriota bacterium]
MKPAVIKLLALFNNKPLGVPLCLRAFVAIFIVAASLLAGETLSAQQLTFEEALWARNDETGRLVAASEAVFRRGEEVNLVLRQVKTFQAGKDGKCQFDIDLLVKDPKGNIILDKKNLLGEDGHIELKDGIASSPYGIFESSVGLEPGQYQMTLTIRDIIGGAKLTTTQPFTLSPGLSYQKVIFAKEGSDGTLNPVNDPTFARGEKVNLVFINVGKFMKDASGKHSFDIDMVVKNSEGKQVLKQEKMLGEKGHIVLENDIADSPYGIFYSSLDLAPGVYYMTLTVYDKIANDNVNVTKPFILK